MIYVWQYDRKKKTFAALYLGGRKLARSCVFAHVTTILRDLLIRFSRSNKKWRVTSVHTYSPKFSAALGYVSQQIVYVRI